MKLENVYIGTARIHGLRSEPHYFAEKDCYEWCITFSEETIINYCDLLHIYLDKKLPTAAKILNNIIYNFNSIGIADKSKVAVIFSVEDNKVIAIAHTGTPLWIDVTDGFSIKTFSQLNIVITGLEVF